MKRSRKVTTTFAAGFLALFLPGGGDAQAQDKNWTIKERTVPLPAGASDVLRDSIAGTQQPDVARHIQQTTFKTLEQLASSISAADAGSAQR